jgi:hypothetical protein
MTGGMMQTRMGYQGRYRNTSLVRSRKTILGLCSHFPGVDMPKANVRWHGISSARCPVDVADPPECEPWGLCVTVTVTGTRLHQSVGCVLLMGTVESVLGAEGVHYPLRAAEEARWLAAKCGCGLRDASFVHPWMSAWRRPFDDDD